MEIVAGVVRPGSCRLCRVLTSLQNIGVDPWGLDPVLPKHQILGYILLDELGSGHLVCVRTVDTGAHDPMLASSRITSCTQNAFGEKLTVEKRSVHLHEHNARRTQCEPGLGT